jgi:hypothetical protein
MSDFAFIALSHARYNTAEALSAALAKFCVLIVAFIIYIIIIIIVITFLMTHFSQ